MTHGPSVSSVAARMGSAAFLLPLMVTSPCSGTPPLIKKLSMRIKIYSAADLHRWAQMKKTARPRLKNLCFICVNLWLKNQSRATRILAR
jgi:hypothetical protein